MSGARESPTVVVETNRRARENLADAGDVVAGGDCGALERATAAAVSAEFASQSSATSSSVGPIALFSEGAR